MRAAGPPDEARVRDLLTRADLTLAGLGDAELFVAETAGRVVGAAGLETHGRYGLLRSVVVDAASRGTGVGRALTTHVVDLARRRGLTALYLLTTTAAAYFPRAGFARVGADDVPAELRASAEFRGACPDTAVIMRLALAAA